jgi:hypothetical protein
MFAFIAGLIGLLIVVCLWGFGIAATIFWLWMLIHALTNKGIDSVEKLVWFLVIFFLHFLGALIYFFIGRPKAAGAFS